MVEPIFCYSNSIALSLVEQRVRYLSLYCRQFRCVSLPEGWEGGINQIVRMLVYRRAGNLNNAAVVNQDSIYTMPDRSLGERVCISTCYFLRFFNITEKCFKHARNIRTYRTASLNAGSTFAHTRLATEIYMDIFMENSLERTPT